MKPVVTWKAKNPPSHVTKSTIPMIPNTIFLLKQFLPRPSEDGPIGYLLALNMEYEQRCGRRRVFL